MEIKNRKKAQKASRPKQNPVRPFLDARFLLSKQVTFWYPYIFYLFVLVVFMVFNEQEIGRKQEKLQKLDDDYKKEIGRLEKHNQFIPYNVKQNIENAMKNKGFKATDSCRYYIKIKKAENEI
jgi:hypothetical protein